MTNLIHKTAIIDPKTELASDVRIGPYSVIGPGVKIDSGTVIGPHAVIQGPSTIGKHNHIFQFASVGEAPQDLSYKGEPTRLEMGDHNVVRESVTIHRGTAKDRGLTKIGDHNFIMGCSHIAHDCTLGNYNVLANTATLAGHVALQDHVGISAFCAIHQFVQIGSYAYVARGALVAKDVMPYVMAVGNGTGAKIAGLNSIGLQRYGFSNDVIKTIRQAYKIIYRNNEQIETALEKLAALAKEVPEVKAFIQCIENSNRGILR